MRTWCFSLIFSLLSFASLAQDEPFVEAMRGMLRFNNGQIMSLAEAIPDSVFSWSPAEGVRSVAGVLEHVARANYFYAPYFAIDLPADYDREIWTRIQGKPDLLAAVQASFDFADDYLGRIDASDLDPQVELPFGTFSKRQLLLIMMDHSGEHKGQLIAYARSNGIVPPWSQ